MPGFPSGGTLSKGITDDERVVSWRAAASYLVLACATTWPLVRQLGSALPGWAGDSAQATWMLDTFWTMLSAGENPLGITQRIFYPHGIATSLVLSAPSVAILAGPFWLAGVRGLVLFYGLLILLAPVVGGLGIRAAVLRLTGSPRAAWGAGLLYGVAPAIATSLAPPFYMRTWGFVALLPWALASLLAFLDRPDARACIAVSVCTWALAFTDFYAIATWLVLGTVVGLARWRRALLRPVLAIGLGNLGLALVVARWVLVPINAADLSPGFWLWDRTNIVLSDLVRPIAMPMLWKAQVWHGALGHLTVLDVNNPGNPASYFLGYATVALALLGLRRRTLGLACGAVVVGLFACGTAAHWTRQPPGAAPMPWLPLSWLGGVAWAGVIDNVRSFTCALPAPLVILAGVGLARLPARVIVPVACGAALLDAPGFGIPTNTVAVPAVYQEP